MNYWLMKTEPDTFSIDDLKSLGKKAEPWEGVRNYQARNFMRDDMKLGDMVLFYHSSCKVPGVAGIGVVAKESHPDITQFDKKSKYFDLKATKDIPRWFMVSIKFIKKFDQVISLTEMKENKKLIDFALLKKGQRLSIMPVAKKHFEIISSLGS